jgi:hypothetical protein
MKTKFSKIKEVIRSFIDWVVYWGSIILVMSVFILGAMMVGNVIGRHVWIVFLADFVFFYLLWKLLDISYKRRQLTIKKRIIIWLSLVLFVFIALTTLGVAMVTEQRVIANVIIFPIGCFIILAVYMTRKQNALY